MIKLLEDKDSLLEYKIIKSRPMDLKSGKIFFVDFSYGDGKKRVYIGKQVFVIGK